MKNNEEVGVYIMNPDHEFFIHVDDDEKHLEINLKKLERSPADYIDQEMAKGKNKEVIELCGADQNCFEYFVEHYGSTYRFISLFKCQLISDLSPLEKMHKLEYVGIFWNIRATELWDISKNKRLKALRINDCKKLTLNPKFPTENVTLEELEFGGDMDSKYPMETLQSFSVISSLKKLELYCIKPKENSLGFLDDLPNLKEFNFDAGMFTTEEIAFICAKHPHLKGQYLGPYGEGVCDTEVRVSGFRKPTLELPRQQSVLDKYIKQFEELVKMYFEEV